MENSWLVDVGISLVVFVAIAAIWRSNRCSHPNPHYSKDGRYICYECGRSWAAKQRDAAWRSTGVVQRYHGYDESKAVNAATRASIEMDQRRILAVRRALSGPDVSAEAETEVPRVAKRRRASANVINLDTRRPA